MKKNLRVILLYFVILAALLAVVASQMQGTVEGKTTDLATSEFVTAVKEDRVETAQYRVRDARLTGTYWESASDKSSDAEAVKFQSTYIGEDSLAALMADHPAVEYKVDTSTPSPWLSLLGTLIPVLLMGGILVYFLSQMQGGNNRAMQFGKAKARLNSPDTSKVTFKDVAGADEAVEELEEIREFLADPSRFQAMGAKIPRGVLLVGPPGTGKTLLARAVAGEANVPFFSISGSDFVEMFVGVGASRVRDLFEQAKAQAPSIIFIDEIDAVGRHRGAGLGGGHDEREQTLNQLLVEMDGFDVNDSVILIAATNRPDILDPALLRPGRFDRRIVVDRPDRKGRLRILEVHAKGKPFGPDVDLETIAQRTPGFTGADLANLLNEAALLAARHRRSSISRAELDEAVDRVLAGPERRSRVISDRERRVIAYHEAGHALVGHHMEHADPIHKISIVSRGQALGYTLALPEEDRFLTSRSEMLDDLAMFLGGRVAEEIALGEITTGASNDLERATKLARQMVTRYGMTEALGSQVYGDSNHEVFLGRDYSANPDYSPETAARIDAEVSRIMGEARDRAKTILVDNKAQLDLIADVLIERETVDVEAVTALLENRWDEFLADERAKADAAGDTSVEAEEALAAPEDGVMLAPGTDAPMIDVPQLASEVPGSIEGDPERTYDDELPPLA